MWGFRVLYTFLENFMTLCIFLLAGNLSSRIGLLISHTMWGCRWFSKHCQGFQKTSFQNNVKVFKRLIFKTLQIFSKELSLYFSRFSNTCRRETSSFANFSNQSLRFTRYFVILTFIQLDFNLIKIRFHIFSLFSVFCAKHCLDWNACWSEWSCKISCKMIIYVCIYYIL